VPVRIANLLEERRNLEREISELRQQVAMGGGVSEDASAAKDIGGVLLASRKLDGVPAKELKPLVDSLKTQLGSGVVAVVSVIDGKASLVVGVTDDLTEMLNAVDLVRAGSAAVGGKGGGGRPDMAQAGGPDGAAAGAAIAAIEGVIAERA
jgi:alanyl-tRNA synthetase